MEELARSSECPALDQQPAGFLKLPLELRQQILFDSFASAYAKDVELNILLKQLDPLVLNRTYERPVVIANMCRLAADPPSVHPAIGRDLGFPLKLPLDKLESHFIKRQDYAKFLDMETRNRWTRMIRTSGGSPLRGATIQDA